jgi:aminopeptidase-like protein
MIANDTYNFSLFRDVLRLNLGIAQADNWRAMELISQQLPLKVQSFKSRSEHNGWVIPDQWTVRKAVICHDGKTVFDGTVHPLAVAQMSSSFRGRVSKSELDRHVYFNRDLPEAYAYHCRYQYRPWETHWGFCIPFAKYRTWPEGEYDVELDTVFEPGALHNGEAVHRGSSPQTVLFQAHSCHPTQANDNIVGIMVIAALFRWLQGRKTRYTYKALFAPEHIGTVFHIRDLPPDELSNTRLGIFVEAVGGRRPFSLQESFHGDHIHDRFVKLALRHDFPDARVGPFGTVLGNDESVWEAPGVEVPMISISRFPFREYHTSEDTLDQFGPESLDDTLNVLKGLVDMLEDDVTVRRKFTGIVALSNPEYGLYKEHPDPAYVKPLSDMDLRFARMQDLLARFFDGKHTAFDIAERFDIPFPLIRSYLGEFQEKGLVELHPVLELDFYNRHRAGDGAASI